MKETKGIRHWAIRTAPSSRFISTRTIALAGAQRHNALVSLMILDCQSWGMLRQSSRKSASCTCCADQPGLNTGDEAPGNPTNGQCWWRRPFAQEGFFLWPDDCLYYSGRSGPGEAQSVDP